MKHCTARNISVQWDSGGSYHKLIISHTHTHCQYTRKCDRFDLTATRSDINNLIFRRTRCDVMYLCIYLHMFGFRNCFKIFYDLWRLQVCLQ